MSPALPDGEPRFARGGIIVRPPTTARRVSIGRGKAPVETKVIASAGVTPLAAALAEFVVWLLGVTVFGDDPQTAALEGDGVPVAVSALVLAVIATAAVYAAGYLAPHTQRTSEQDGPSVPTLPD